MSDKVNKIALGMRWGALLSGLEIASNALTDAAKGANLLDQEWYERFHQVAESISGIRQAAWIAYDKERKR